MSDGTSFVRQLALVIAAIGGTTLFVWNKVQFEDVSRRTSAAERSVERLLEDRTKLRAKVMQKSRPGTIKSIAEQRLGMSLPQTRGVVTIDIGDTVGDNE